MARTTTTTNGNGNGKAHQSIRLENYPTTGRPIGIKESAYKIVPSEVAPGNRQPFINLVVLFNPQTNDQKTLWIESYSLEFRVIMEAVFLGKKNYQLLGYEVVEVMGIANQSSLY